MRELLPELCSLGRDETILGPQVAVDVIIAICLGVAGHEFGEQAADRASRLGSAIREKVGRAREQTEQVAHNLFPNLSSHKGSAADAANRGAADIQSHTQKPAKDAVRLSHKCRACICLG